MIKNQITYLVLLAGIILFYILFVDSMSLLILIITVVFPVLQFVILMIVSRNISATLSTESQTVYRNTENKIIIRIKNHSVLPVSCAVVSLQITNSLTNETQSLTTMIPVSSDNEQSIKFSVSYAHCGKISVNLDNIKVYDYIKLFSKKISFGLSQEITVLPSLAGINPEVQTTLSTMTDSDEFSKIKPGDDCSEIFNIREYIYGDKINRIHWNLTTKLDELMIKEYSLPVSCHIIIIFEFCTDNNSDEKFSKNDAAIEAAMSLSYYMVSNGISHKIAWYDSVTKLFNTVKISTETDFSVFLGSIFSSGTYDDYYKAFLHHKAENGDSHFSHAIYVSPVVTDEIFHNFSVLRNAVQKTYLYISDGYDVPEYFVSTESANAVSVNCENISEGLNKVIV